MTNPYRVLKLMDLEGNKFGRGPKELGGAVDLINHFKLYQHHEFFCKRSLPISISDSHYLQNVVGEKKIKKGEGMDLDQLFQNPNLQERRACLRPFDLDILQEAFHMREPTPIDLPYAEKAVKLRSESKDKERKHKKHRKRDKDGNKVKEHKKHKQSHNDGSKDKEKDNKSRNGNYVPVPIPVPIPIPIPIPVPVPVPEHLKKQQEKSNGINRLGSNLRRF